MPRALRRLGHPARAESEPAAVNTMSTSGCKRAQHRGPGSPAGTCSRMPLRHGPPGGAGRQGQPNAPAQACSSPYSRFAPARSPPVKPVPPSTRAPSTDEPARRRSTPSAHCRTPHQPVWRSRDTTGPPPAKPPPHAKPPGRRPTDQTGQLPQSRARQPRTPSGNRDAPPL